MFSDEPTTTIRAGLAALGIERLTLAIHDASFPSTVEEDLGRGSPYGLGARSLLALAARQGFDSVQLGPQGDTSESNPSPYDGAIFTKSPMSIALATLREDPLWAPLCEGLLPPVVDAAARVSADGTRSRHGSAWKASRRILTALYQRFVDRKGAGGALEPRFEAFRRAWADTLGADGLYEGLTAEHRSDDWRRWPELDQRLLLAGGDASESAARRAFVARAHAHDIEEHAFGQFVLDEQHRGLRTVASGASLRLFGDLQIGFSHRDVWSSRDLFRADYLMGAPPSRTNPAGQAWGYPALDVDGARDRVLALVDARVRRMVHDFDGVRIDHPHGLVCPWVYAALDPEPDAAVMRGARLRCSPNLPDHPRLAAIAIPTTLQLSVDPGIARYADDWVRQLRDDQVARYGILFDALMTGMRRAGRRESDVVCEVLSTLPYPLRRVMERYGLGRFCVTQKADLARPDDVYRGENASARDWIMVGNHDTPPVWRLADDWHGSVVGSERALVLAARLAARPDLRPRLARWLSADPRHLCHGMFAELFLGPSRRISVFFADLFGLEEIYNRPGVVHDDNWTLRLPPDFAERYARATACGAAFNVPLALTMALAARGGDGACDPALARRMAACARGLSPDIDTEIWSLMADAIG